VPDDEQLMMVPFKVGELAGMRLVRVVPGVAAQFPTARQGYVGGDRAGRIW
jgi:hypothetical protein